MSLFAEGDRVKIVRPDDGRMLYSRIEHGYVIGFNSHGLPLVRYNFKFNLHEEPFEEEELVHV